MILILVTRNVLIYISDDEVCFDVKITTVRYGADTMWWLGTCSSNGLIYDHYKKYIHRCCLRPGQHTLTCINKQNPYGWGDGHIEIQGHRYCNDFMSYRLIQRIIIRSMIIIIFMSATLIILWI